MKRTGGSSPLTTSLKGRKSVQSELWRPDGTGQLQHLFYILFILILDFRVDVRITSVASFLPSSDDNNATFTGTTHGPGSAPALTPAEQTTKSLQQYEAQIQDAKIRRIVYDADGLCDQDADGEDDLDYSPNEPTDDAPIGMRGEDDSIIPLPADTELRPSPMEVDTPSAATPMNIGQLVIIPRIVQLLIPDGGIFRTRPALVRL